jgi:DNA-directed RNA polymerase subunit RPC12/RpoP
VPKLPGREPTFVTYPLSGLLIDYWLGPHDAGQVHRCVGCGLASSQWAETANNWGAVAQFDAGPAGVVCPTCAEKILAMHR